VQISRFERQIAEAELVVMDGNLPPESMKHICELCRANSVPGQYKLQYRADKDKIILIINFLKIND